MGLAKVIQHVLAEPERAMVLRPFPGASCPGTCSQHGSGRKESTGLADGQLAQNAKLDSSR